MFILSPTEKTHKRLATIPREVCGETARRRNGRDNRDARRKSLLHHLERDAPAQKQDVCAKRQAVFQQGPPDYLIQRIVTAHVFAEHKELAGQIENGASMQAASIFKRFLRRGECLR